MPTSAPRTMPPVPWMGGGFRKETFGATETTPVTLKPDQFLALDTGDPIPKDKDAVIMVEDCEEWRWFHHHSRSRSPVAAYPPDRRGCMRRGNDFAQPYDRFPGCHWCDDCFTVCWKLK